jgi:autotransporter translocation and assembly factor TamB
MDKLLLRGEQLKAVARRYSVSEDALGRHKRHMQIVIAKAATLVEQKDVAYGSALMAEIGRIRADAERLQLESERRQDVRGALRAIHERLAVVELEAKLSGQIDTSQKNLTINVQAISQEEAVEYARDVLELFAPTGSPSRILPLPVIDAEPVIPMEGGCDAN